MSDNAKAVKPVNSPEQYGRDQVINIINSVLDRVQGADFSAKEVLYGELQDLKKVIEEAREQIGAARPNEIKGVHIPTATDELDAVVDATEEATGTIMDSCEEIQNNLQNLSGEGKADIETAVTRIFEACSFQDITGQRITKVVGTLRIIEEKVGKIISVLERKMPGLRDAAALPSDSLAPSDDKSLLNGPQMPDKAITQDDIDKLLAEFDN